MDREVWRATVHRVEKSQTWLSDYHLERLFGGLTVSKALKMCSNFFSSVLALCTNSRNQRCARLNNLEQTQFPIPPWPFFSGRKRSLLTINKHKIKSYPGGLNHLKSIVIVMSRFIRFLCASLNFVSISRLWKSLRNCPVKSPSDCLRLIVYKRTSF